MKRKGITDYSPLFRGMTFRRSLPISDEEGRSYMTINGVKVEGSRQVLERVRDGLLRNGGPQRIQFK